MVFLTQVCLKYMPHWLRRPVVRNGFFKKEALFSLTQFYRARYRNCWRSSMNKWTTQQTYDMIRRQEARVKTKELFQQRILGAVEENGFTYELFMENLQRSGIQLTKRALANLAIYEPRTFKSLVDISKAKWCADAEYDDARHAKPPPGVIHRGML